MAYTPMGLLGSAPPQNVVHHFSSEMQKASLRSLALCWNGIRILLSHGLIRVCLALFSLFSALPRPPMLAQHVWCDHIFPSVQRCQRWPLKVIACLCAVLLTLATATLPDWCKGLAWPMRQFGLRRYFRRMLIIEIQQAKLLRRLCFLFEHF